MLRRRPPDPRLRRTNDPTNSDPSEEGQAGGAAPGQDQAGQDQAGQAQRPPDSGPLRPAGAPDRPTAPAGHPGPSSFLLALYGTWAPLHARINAESTPERTARRLYGQHRALQKAITAVPVASLTDLAAKVLALTEHGTLELPEALVEECQAIVAGAVP